MKREILFHGKRVDNGAWVEGSLIDLDADSGYVYIMEPYRQSSTLSIKDLIFLRSVLVVPSTVGQFSGKTDRNGKKIFEGDIIKCEKSLLTVVWRGTMIVPIRCNKRQATWEYAASGEVVGNIHDQPSREEAIEGTVKEEKK